MKYFIKRCCTQLSNNLRISILFLRGGRGQMSINTFMLKQRELNKLDCLFIMKDTRFITEIEIKKKFNLSYYQSKKVVEELYADIQETSFAKKFKYINRILICETTENIDLLVKTLIGTYYYKSKKARFIMEWILIGRNFVEISENIDLSISKIYELKSELDIFIARHVQQLDKEHYEIFYRRILLTIVTESSDLFNEYYNSDLKIDKFVQSAMFKVAPLLVIKLSSESILKIKIILFVIYYRNKNNFIISIELFDYNQFSLKHLDVIQELSLLSQIESLKIERSDFFFCTVINLLSHQLIYLIYLKREKKITRLT